jgi:protein-disulfide isomerase
MRAVAPALCLAILGVLATYVAVKGLPPTTTSRPQALGQRLSLLNIHKRGNNTARTVLVVFSDFECPYCGEFARDRLPTVIRQFVDAGTLLVGFQHLPLVTLHPLALEVATFAECASQQIDFWDVHDRLFSNQTQLDATRRGRLFRNSPLNVSKMSDCMAGPTPSVVAGGTEIARRLGLTSTPALVLGRNLGAELEVTEVLEGVPTVEQLAAALNRQRR